MKFLKNELVAENIANLTAVELAEIEADLKNAKKATKKLFVNTVFAVNRKEANLGKVAYLMKELDDTTIYNAILDMAKYGTVNKRLVMIFIDNQAMKDAHFANAKGDMHKLLDLADTYALKA